MRVLQNVTTLTTTTTTRRTTRRTTTTTTFKLIDRDARGENISTALRMRGSRQLPIKEGKILARSSPLQKQALLKSAKDSEPLAQALF